MSTNDSDSTKSFFDLLKARIALTNSLLCIGLDPHRGELDALRKEHGSADLPQLARIFCDQLIETTLPYAACYKPNAAFFEQLGSAGHEVLKRVAAKCRQHQVPVLLDVKRGDIGSTATAYAVAAYDECGADAVTLSPLMGWDSVQPFVTGKYANKAAFLLCKTSNPTSQEFMALHIQQDATTTTLYEHIAHVVGHEWKAKCNKHCLGLVVGATDAVALKSARQAAGDHVWILAPGVGAQGGDLAEACAAGLDSTGSGLLIPVSRGISRAKDPQQAARELQQAIHKCVLERKATAAKKDNADDEQPAAKKPKSDVLLPYQRDFIIFALQEGVLKFGEFVLKSGRTSPYFFNAGLFCTGQALHQLAKAYATAIWNSPVLTTTDDKTGKKQCTFDVVFGPAYKGISLGAVVSTALYAQYGVTVGFAYNRKEAKTHGEGGNLVGADMTNQRVLVVDDVITAGTAIRESYDMLVAIQAKVVGVVIALDRAEKRSLDDPVSAVQAVARDMGVPVVSIVSLPQLQTFLSSSSEYGPEVLQSVSEYRAQYGVESNT